MVYQDQASSESRHEVHSSGGLDRRSVVYLLPLRVGWLVSLAADLLLSHCSDDLAAATSRSGRTKSCGGFGPVAPRHAGPSVVGFRPESNEARQRVGSTAIWVESVVIEIGGADDSRHSTQPDCRSRLTFWPLLQQFPPTREARSFGRHCAVRHVNRHPTSPRER